MEGYDAFYNDKVATDNPYIGTYNRPEIIIEGVNDDGMSDDDWDKHHRFKAWVLGFKGAELKTKEYAEAMQVKNEVEVLEEKVKSLENDKAKLVSTLGNVALEMQLLIKHPPFLKKNVLKDLKNIRDFYTGDA